MIFFAEVINKTVMKKLIIFLISIIFSVVCFAQQLKVVEELHKDENNTLAVKYPRLDYSKTPCGLILLGMVIPDAEFEGDIIHTEYKKGEWWIYMIDGGSWLKIKTNNYLPLLIEFKTPIESSITYLMSIEKPNYNSMSSEQTNLVNIHTDRNGDLLYIDGNFKGISPLEIQLGFGSHKVEAERNGKRVAEEIIVTEGQPQTMMLQFVKNRTFTVNDVSFTMITVDGGRFTMGCSSGQEECYDTEKPAHAEYVLDFMIGETEVTQELWMAVMGSNPSSFKGDLLPVDNISWNDCEIFLDKLNKLTGQNFRLPTEAEWEYAARGGNKTKGYKYSGSDNVDDVAWHYANSGNRTHKVKTKTANELGIYDMSGNVAEWCSDYWRSSYNDSFNSNSRVLRGGSWADISRKVRFSNRDYDTPQFVSTNYGLRLVSECENKDKQTTTEKENSPKNKTVWKENKTFEANGINFTMVAVHGGTYTMGCTTVEEGVCFGNEKPAHQEEVDDFMIGETEVTQELWQAVMGGNPSHFTGDLQRPVENVSWDDCKTFINRLNQITGLNFRLPTEAEWEYAARGGNKSKGYKYCGSNDVDDVAWYNDNSRKKTRPVKKKKANELGIYDMSGNVWEWCEDYWRANYDVVCNYSDRILRGGSWGSNARTVRITIRSLGSPSKKTYNYGFRLAL